ncbi:hypothetical protein [Methylocapsa aurea]|uniref:hypothetical protein n=1 Tax=Methylocapsa aurea TaxID=663610 RepID=UPI0012EC952F|nr:hypothetical protein [Methylocapsa aurea]
MSKRIFFVEDAFDNPQILRDLLANAGFELLQATDGDAGVCGEALSTRAILARIREHLS